MKNDIYYDYRKVDSYNRILNFILGARGVGKTYGFKKKCIERFLKDGGQFIYMRRTPDELNTPKAKELFWPQGLKKEFSDVVLGYQSGGVYTIDKGNGPEIAGYAMALSRAGKEKSIEYDKVKLVCFDEFIIEKQLYHYLPGGEYRTLQEAMVTICRDRDDCKFYLLANSLSWINPYFVNYKIFPPEDPKQEIIKGKNWLVHVTSNEAFTEHMRKTKLGKLFDEVDGEYFDYAYKNNLLNDTRDFLKKKSKYAAYYFTLIYNNQKFGVWYDVKLDEYYITNGADDEYPLRFAFSKSDHREGSTLLTTRRPFIKSLVAHFSEGAVFFDSLLTKGCFYDWLKFIGY